MVTGEFIRTLFRTLHDGEFIELRVVNKAGEAQGSRFLGSVEEAIEATSELPTDMHVYFGVAPRNQRAGTKSAVARVQVLWADYDAKAFGDDKEVARTSVKLLLPPPSVVVDSGHGYHAYWLLVQSAEPAAAETAMRLIRERTGADKTTDASRVMRLPGSWNVKSDPPLQCTVVESNPSAYYLLEDLVACAKLNESTRRLVLMGEWEGQFPSRSERDYHVVLAMQRAGVSDGTIRAVFDYHPVGAKHQESQDTKYLERTLKQAASRMGGAVFEEQKDDSTYAPGKGGWHRVATFTFQPKRLLEHPLGDVLVGTMRSRGYSWENYQLPKPALSSVRALLQALPELTLMWEGSDRELRLWASYLMDKLMQTGLKKATGVSSIGRHEGYWVTPTTTYDAKGPIGPDDAPIVFVSVERVAPTVNYDAGLALPVEELKVLLGQIAQWLPSINTPETLWPILGWSFATPFKPLLEELGVRFPLLNLYGTRGSGKTATMQDVVFPMLGYTEARSMDCNTTQFVLLAWLSSTNAVPVALAEFRRSTLGPQDWSKLRRFLLTSYDVGHDARGRADQTTQEYALTAPMSLDGEDKPMDPAVMERSIVVNLIPEDIREGSDRWMSFVELTSLPLNQVAGPYILFTLSLKLQDVAARWATVTAQVHQAFPQELPDRVRRNLSVCWFGVCALQEFFQQHELALPVVEPIVLSASLDEVVTASGRTFLFTDDFVEDIVNAVSLQQASQFRWRYDSSANVLWIHLAPALKWWYAARRRQGLDVLEPTAIKRQLKERDGSVRPGPGQYMMGYKNINCMGTIVHMHGIDLTVARMAGIDIPETLPETVTYSFTIPKGGSEKE